MPLAPPMTTTISMTTRNFKGKLGSTPPTTSAARAPPRPAKPLPTAKVMANSTSTLTPRPDAGQGRDQESQRQRRQKGHAGAVHQQGGDITAEHCEGAMREVDEVHQPERHGEAGAQHEQQHAIGDAVEQQRQHEGVAPSWPG